MQDFAPLHFFLGADIDFKRISTSRLWDIERVRHSILRLQSRRSKFPDCRWASRLTEPNVPPIGNP